MTLPSWLRLLRATCEPSLVHGRHKHRKAGPRKILTLEQLEERTLLSTFWVTNTGDNSGVNPLPGAGTGTLRQAIIDADAAATGTAANPDLIAFDIPTTDPGYNSSTGAFTIQPLSTLPTVTDTVTIDGYTQPGASPNTLTIGDNAVLNIVLDGSLAGAVDGLVIGAGNCTVRGFVIDNFGYGSGIVLNGSGNDVAGNFIGTDVMGESVAANNNGIESNCSGNMIGGTSPAERNIISGNNSGLPDVADGGANPSDDGISGGNGTLIQGNYIGTDKMGTSALPNGGPNRGHGIYLSSNNTIGGTSAGAGNVISGNTAEAIGLVGNQNVVAGNMIGTTANGLAALDNGDGIHITGNSNTIGGTTASARNIISGNAGPGSPVSFGIAIDGQYAPNSGSYNLVEGNYIGTDVTGTTSLFQVTGILITGDNNTIGGTTAAARNIISGNINRGIIIFMSFAGGVPFADGFGNVVQGNYIGTDASGTRAVPNGVGIGLLGGVYDNTIGGTLPGAGNVISGNGGGIDIENTTADNLIQGNLIGTNGTSTAALGNRIYGIATGNDPTNNTIGGTASGAGNTIAFNGEYGVDLEGGTGTSILGNSIHDNASLGINLASGANDNQAAPVLLAATSSGTGTAIAGTLAAYPNSAFRVEFFSNPSAAPGQGQTFLGFAQVSTDGQGNFSANLPTVLRPGTFLSATATDANGNTSEFAADITVKGALTVNTNSSLMLVGNNPPPLTGTVNGTPFTGSITYTTSFGDQVTVALGTAATSANAVGQYAITATLSGASAANYFIDPGTSTTGTMYVVSIGPDPSSTTGAQAVTFWDNSHNANKLITKADLSSLDGLNLVDQHGVPFDPTTVAQLRAWLSTGPNATTAYQLAAQLAAMDLNVLTGYVKATDLVYAGGLLPYASAYGITGLTSGGFIDVQYLMQAANAVLGQVSPGTPDPNQAFEAALTSVFQAANANSDFVTQELLWGLVGTFV
jgi:hypothetical protein